LTDNAIVEFLFDAVWYVETYKDVKVCDAWEHFQLLGTIARRDPNPMFCTTWYLRQYPDVVGSSLQAMKDYVCRGVALGRDPGPLFSTRWYLASNPDVAVAGINPLQHYLDCGQGERRDPSPVFDSAWYFSLHPYAATPGADARSHYMKEGARLGYDPCTTFSTQWYLDTYSEVAASGENPLLHYLTTGAERGLDPSPDFSTSHYLASHKEVAASGENPLAHYRAHLPSRGAQPQMGRITRDAVAEVRAVIQALSPIEPDLAALPETFEAVSVESFTLDRCAAAWRKLYLSIYELPQCLVLAGSIDETSKQVLLVESSTRLLIVETDVQLVSTAEFLPRGIQWRSLSEFGADLDLEDRIKLVTALVNGLQPAALLVSGSQTGWEMLARYGRALRHNTALFGITESTSGLSSDPLLSKYFRRCIPVLSALFGPDEHELHSFAAMFGLPPSERDKLRNLRDWRGGEGFL
jgi:hypothetical protein